MNRDMDKIFEESFRDFRLMPEYKGVFDASRFGSAVDLKEAGSNYVVNAYLPDREIKDVNVTVEDRTLKIMAKAEESTGQSDSGKGSALIRKEQFTQMLAAEAGGTGRRLHWNCNRKGWSTPKPSPQSGACMPSANSSAIPTCTSAISHSGWRIRCHFTSLPPTTCCQCCGHQACRGKSSTGHSHPHRPYPPHKLSGGKPWNGRRCFGKESRRMRGSRRTS